MWSDNVSTFDRSGLFRWPQPRTQLHGRRKAFRGAAHAMECLAVAADPLFSQQRLVERRVLCSGFGTVAIPSASGGRTDALSGCRRREKVTQSRPRRSANIAVQYSAPVLKTVNNSTLPTFDRDEWAETIRSVRAITPWRTMLYPFLSSMLPALRASQHRSWYRAVRFGF